MLYIYALLILLAAFPLVLTIWRMRVAAKIKKEGIYTNGTVVHINSIRMPKGGRIDMLKIEYKDRATGRSYNAKATVNPGAYKIGDPMPVVYLPNSPAKYAIDTKKAYWAILIFCILLFAFVLFAVYKLNEMTVSGQM